MAKTIIAKTFIPVEYCIEVEDDFDENNQKQLNKLFRVALEQEFSCEPITHNVKVTSVYPGTYEELLTQS